MSKQCDDFQFPSDFRRAKSGDEISKLITTFHETMNKEFGEKEVNLEDLAERLGEALEVRRQKLFDEMFTDQTSRIIG